MKEEFDWEKFLKFVFILALYILVVWVIFQINKVDEETKEFCESKLNGTIKISNTNICLVEEGNVVYGVKLIKKNGEWKVYIE